METSAFALIYFHCLSSALSCDLPPVGDDKLVVSGLPDGDDAVLPDRFLRFSCKGPGTALKGSPMVICGKDGQWASPFPTCEGKASHLSIVSMWDLRDKTVFQLIKLCFMCSRDYLSGATSAPSPQGDWTSTREWNGKDWAYIAFLLQQWQPVGGPWRSPMSGKWPVELPLPQVCRCAHLNHSQTSPSSLMCI